MHTALSLADTQAALATFTRRWHHLERSLGARGGLVIDFDLAPRALAPLDIEPFADRERALDALNALRDHIEDAPDVVNRPFLRAHLAGSEAYLRALMGERAPFDAYLRATMGVTPVAADPERQAARRESLIAEFGALGIGWGPDGYTALRASLGRTGLEGFEQELRAHANALVARLRGLVAGLAEPDYRIEVVAEDAYWANWIDGSIEDGVCLRVNTHPRIEYVHSSPLQLAAHEIAGHAVHVASLRAAAVGPAPTVDPGALLLTVHACEAYQSEGLAQAMVHYLLRDVDLPEEVALLERYREYSGDAINSAQLRVEAGEPIDRVCAEVIQECPLSKPLSVRSSLRDRSLNPLQRAYIHVYAPSRLAYLRALELPPAAFADFLAANLTHLLTPAQVDRLLDGEPVASVRA